MKQNYNKKIGNKSKIKLWILDFEDKRHRRLIILFSILFCLFLTWVCLYEPAKNYYKSIREHEKLTTQYQLLQAYNKSLETNIEFLQTEEGIKNTAKQKLNLVQEGENAAYVSNLDYLEAEQSSSDFNTKYNSKNIIYPKTWISTICDFIFNVTV